jgi:hypothetical protein
MSGHSESPALRHAILRVQPEYFFWKKQEQEKYRVNIPREDDFTINQHLFQKLFNITVHTQEQLRMEWDNLSMAQLLILNENRLPIQGVGDDVFFLNDVLMEGKTILDYETLYDYDVEDHAFQERSRKEQWPEHHIRPYHGSLYHRWARLYVDDQFIYATLSCAGCYIYGELETHGFDHLHALIPHAYVPGRHHGEQEESGIRWDFRIDAGGREDQLDELKNRFTKYLIQRNDELAEIWDQRHVGRAYVIDKSSPDDPSLSFVFSDPSALKQIRFRHFMTDVRAIEAPQASLDREIASEKTRLQAFLDTQLADINDNFDPKVIKLRPRRKVILSPRAARDINMLE